MNRGSYLARFALIATLAVLGVIAFARPVQADPKNCTHVSGTFLFDRFEFTGPTTAFQDGRVVGDLTGTTHADYFNIEQKGRNGVFHMNGMHTIVTAEGTIFTFDEIRLQFDQKNPLIARANSRLYIVGGTGKYEGATGVLHTHGSLNVATLEGGIDFKGQICLP
jgi:hypothetical protein